MSASTSNPSQSQLSEEFMTRFNEQKEELLQQIERLKPEMKDEVNEKLTSISEDIQRMNKQLHDAVMFLPSYSVKIRQNEIRDIEKLLKEKEGSLVPKKKFGFKSKVHSNVTTTEAPVDPQLGDSNKNKCMDTNPTLGNHYFTIEGINEKTVEFNESNLNGNDVLVKDSSNSTILLNGGPSTLRLVNLKNCKLLCGPVHTSVFVEKVKDSSLYLCCQQLRTHSSEKVDIYLRVVSRAIIEDCSEIRFGPYDWDHENSKQLHTKANISSNLIRYDAVDDFNWLSSTPSPNWTVVPENQYVKFTI